MEASAPRTRIHWVVSPAWIASSESIAIFSLNVTVVCWVDVRAGEVSYAIASAGAWPLACARRLAAPGS